MLFVVIPFGKNAESDVLQGLLVDLNPSPASTIKGVLIFAVADTKPVSPLIENKLDMALVDEPCLPILKSAVAVLLLFASRFR